MVDWRCRGFEADSRAEHRRARISFSYLRLSVKQTSNFILFETIWVSDKRVTSNSLRNLGVIGVSAVEGIASYSTEPTRTKNFRLTLDLTLEAKPF